MGEICVFDCLCVGNKELISPSCYSKGMIEVVKVDNTNFGAGYWFPMEKDFTNSQSAS